MLIFKYLSSHKQSIKKVLVKGDIQPKMLVHYNMPSFLVKIMSKTCKNVQNFKRLLNKNICFLINLFEVHSLVLKRNKKNILIICQKFRYFLAYNHNQLIKFQDRLMRTIQLEFDINTLKHNQYQPIKIIQKLSSGYTACQRVDNNSYGVDNEVKSFLFQLYHNDRFTLRSNRSEKPIYRARYSVPSFGGHDLTISEDANRNSDSTLRLETLILISPILETNLIDRRSSQAAISLLLSSMKFGKQLLNDSIKSINLHINLFKSNITSTKNDLFYNLFQHY